MIQKRTVGILGCGNVGMAAAYTLFNRDLASELILVDKDERRAEGEAMDLMHGQAFAEPIVVRSGSFADLADAQVIIIAAGTSRSAGESRLDLLNRNVVIFRDIVAKLDEYAPSAILAIATNPVDIITYVVQELSSRAANMVVGTGTMLDTARFRALLGKYYGVDPRSVDAYILGEHGDSEVPIWSHASIGGSHVTDPAPILEKPYDKAALDALFEQARTAGREVIARKGFTSSAIGLVIAELVETILHDQHTILTVSGRVHGEYGLSNVCLSLPSVVGHLGTEGRILPELTAEEQQALKHSAGVLRESIDSIGL